MSKQCIECDWSFRLPLTLKEQKIVRLEDPNAVPLFCAHKAVRTTTPGGEQMVPLVQHVRVIKHQCGPSGKWWIPARDTIPAQGALVTGTFKRVERALGGNINPRQPYSITKGADATGSPTGRLLVGGPEPQHIKPPWSPSPEVVKIRKLYEVTK